MSREGAVEAMQSQRAFVGVSAVLFAASAAVTVAWCSSMSAMGEMEMPGGWTMSMAWMRMPGQTWPGAAASFIGMWVVMMAAMMLPSLVPMLWRYRRAVSEPCGAGVVVRRAGAGCAERIGTATRAGPRLGWLTVLVGAGYFCVWTLLGVVAFPIGIALAMFEMQQPALARAVPVAVGVIVMMAGALQFTAWKARALARCRETCVREASHQTECSDAVRSEAAVCRTVRVGKPTADAGTAWRHGLRLGLHCIYCCAGLTAILLVVGVMDLRAMAVVTVAITAERLAPAGERVARIIGAAVIAAGLTLTLRALDLS